MKTRFTCHGDGRGRLAHMAVLVAGDVPKARVDSARERKGARVGTLCGASPGSGGLAPEGTLKASDQPPALPRGELLCLLEELLDSAHGGTGSAWSSTRERAGFQPRPGGVPPCLGGTGALGPGHLQRAPNGEIAE